MAGIIVTGPPRSGTSATTRLLDLAGAHVAVAADLVGGGPNNPSGHWESKTVLAINNELLEAAGSRWWCPPPPGDVAAFPPVSAAARAAFDAVHPVRPWVCKDPRFAVTMPFWRLVLDEFVCIIVLRRPDEVVASLRRTWPLTVEHATALWARGLCGALATTRGMPVAVVQFPDVLADVASWIRMMSGGLSTLGIGIDLVAPPDPEVAGFVRSPQGVDSAGSEIPQYAWDLWEQLRSVAGGFGVGPLPSQVSLLEDDTVESVLGPLREELRAGRPIDVRPVFARTSATIG